MRDSQYVEKSLPQLMIPGLDKILDNAIFLQTNVILKTLAANFRYTFAFLWVDAISNQSVKQLVHNWKALPALQSDKQMLRLIKTEIST